LISVVTTTYNTPVSILARTWASLKKQTFDDWEWVIWDDSTTDAVWNQVYGFASDERYKVSIHRSHVHSGSIGAVKRKAFMVATGDILVELDHDDELIPDALAEIEAAFQDPVIGFVYSDWCEILPDGQSGKYPDGWAFGYGEHYWSDEYGVWVMKAPPLNLTTISHIVSAPNHVRAWRADVYRQIGGHNPDLPIADDYELVVRTALSTKVAYISRLLYKQHIGGHTAQRQRNDLIQELVAQIEEKYRDELIRVNWDGETFEMQNLCRD
jgi:glycosyltransferase involved in cell wall biosynthesis